MGQPVMFPSIASRTRQHKVARIVRTATGQWYNVINMICSFSLCKFFVAIIARPSLSLELLGNILSGIFAARAHLECTPSSMFCCIYLLAMFRPIITSFTISKYVPVFATILAYDISFSKIFLFFVFTQAIPMRMLIGFRILASLLSVSFVITTITLKILYPVRISPCFVSEKHLCFLFSIVGFSLFCEPGAVLFPIHSPSFAYLLLMQFVFLLVLLEYLFSVGLVILPTLLINLFFVGLIILLAVLDMGIIVKLCLNFFACLALRSKSVFLDLGSCEKLRGCRKEQFTLGALLHWGTGILIHDLNCLSFSALSSCCQSGKATTFSLPMISQGIGNYFTIPFSSMVVNVEGGK